MKNLIIACRKTFSYGGAKLPNQYMKAVDEDAEARPLQMS